MNTFKVVWNDKEIINIDPCLGKDIAEVRDNLLHIETLQIDNRLCGRELTEDSFIQSFIQQK